MDLESLMGSGAGLDLPSGDGPLEVDLDVAPSVEIDVVICPSCGCDNCEVWSTTNARVANCPECSAEFSLPDLAESSAKAVVIAITESAGPRRPRLPCF